MNPFTFHFSLTYLQPNRSFCTTILPLAKTGLGQYFVVGEITFYAYPILPNRRVSSYF